MRCAIVSSAARSPMKWYVVWSWRSVAFGASGVDNGAIGFSIAGCGKNESCTLHLLGRKLAALRIGLIADVEDSGNARIG